ncbi:uncharacterized protein si:ch211-1a19.3 [Brienomyrus brachyistius]|uniref:uncharacterized protein si:ch211-1a19.3 n=1 Tax=Brienomyrus brachyistius TaxID=42636 RepID=UPI0020B2A038|nr:uncharacterized protein si:ch211-1a19.3 [Brienomyrus brachyistius]
MTSSKSSKTTCNIVMAILVIWSIISLIIIIVWATSPEIKDVNKCRTELEAKVQEYTSTSAVWVQDRKALEEHIEKSREREAQLSQDISRLWESQRKTNESLKISMEENVILRDNITVLENETERQRELVKNLTSEITAHKEKLEDLQYNLTQAFHLMESCEASWAAAIHHQRAAESRLNALNTSHMSLLNQLNRCKKDDSSISQQNQQSHQSQPDSGSPRLHISPFALSVLTFVSLHLVLFL